VSEVDFPLRFDARGRTAATTEEDHVRDLVEQVLFTAPGERVNRPTFGSGLLRLVFEPAGEEMATATQYLVQGALQQWLGDRVQVETVQVTPGDGSLEVAVQYFVRATGERKVSRFQRGQVAP
jgi:phage baseplate assembly protein W